MKNCIKELFFAGSNFKKEIDSIIENILEEMNHHAKN